MIDSVMEYFQVLIITCVLIGIVEVLANLFWWRFYFSFGIPMYERKIQLKVGETNLPSADDIEEHAISDSKYHPQITVREIDEMVFGLRETIFFFRLSIPVMHGCVFINRRYNQIEIRGYGNWYVTAFTTIFLVFILSGVIATKDYTFLIIAMGFLAFLANGYMTQKNRFDGMTEVLQKLYGSKSA